MGGCRGVTGKSRYQVSSKVADRQADKHKMQEAEAERFAVNIAQQLRGFGFH